MHTYAVHDYYVVREGVLAYARQRGRFPAGSSLTRGSVCTYNCWIRKCVCLTHVVISGHVAVHSSAACHLPASSTPNEKVPPAGRHKHQPEAQHRRGMVGQHHVLLIRTVLEGSRVRSLPVDPADQICGCAVSNELISYCAVMLAQFLAQCHNSMPQDMHSDSAVRDGRTRASAAFNCWLCRTGRHCYGRFRRGSYSVGVEAKP